MDIHQFMDSSKAHIADVRHRALFHNSFGCFVVEQVFGVTRINSAGKEYSTRDVAEQHIIEDLGRIPSVQDYFQHMEIQQWMGGPRKKTRTVSFDEIEAAEQNHNDRLDD